VAGHQPEPLEVNTARADQLASLPGFSDQRVRAVVAARDSQGGFSNIEQFANAANLAPHEHYRIRGLVTVTPPPAGWPKSSGLGRVVDL
jgi:DNA uptake protein ComE-like DNA-binding protein